MEFKHKFIRLFTDIIQKFCFEVLEKALCRTAFSILTEFLLLEIMLNYTKFYAKAVFLLNSFQFLEVCNTLLEIIQ